MWKVMFKETVTLERKLVQPNAKGGVKAMEKKVAWRQILCTYWAYYVARRPFVEQFQLVSWMDGCNSPPTQTKKKTRYINF
jgi:hypothetical protein